MQPRWVQTPTWMSHFSKPPTGATPPPPWETLVEGLRVAQRRHVDLAGLHDLGVGEVAHEDGLSAPHHRDLLAFLDRREVDGDRCKGLHRGVGVHLVDERPRDRTDRDRAYGSGSEKEEIAPTFAGRCVIEPVNGCVGHAAVPFTISLAYRAHRPAEPYASTVRWAIRLSGEGQPEGRRGLSTRVRSYMSACMCHVQCAYAPRRIVSHRGHASDLDEAVER